MPWRRNIDDAPPATVKQFGLDANDRAGFVSGGMTAEQLDDQISFFTRQLKASVLVRPKQEDAP